MQEGVNGSILVVEAVVLGFISAENGLYIVCLRFLNEMVILLNSFETNCKIAKLGQVDMEGYDLPELGLKTGCIWQLHLLFDVCA